MSQKVINKNTLEVQLHKHAMLFPFNNQPDALIIQIYSVILSCQFHPTLLGSGHQNLHETYQCQMYSRKLLMMGREDARNM
jgi:hypothetical protein